MLFRSALEIWIDNFGSKEARQGLSKINPEQTRARYVEYIRESKQSVKILVGEANHKLFNRKDLAEALRETLASRLDSTVTFVFHKSNDIEIAKKEFESGNEKLISLKQDFPERMHIFWSPKRPQQHYAVIDAGKKVILEEPNHVGGEPFWATVIQNQDRAKKWSDRFDNYIAYCNELEFAS